MTPAMKRQRKWDLRYLKLAEMVASWSKDPSTKTGAVIVDRANRLVSVGYNGFAAGVRDIEERLNDRETKYKLVVHCERNAMLFAARDLGGCTLYTWPFLSCSPCAAMVIQSGIGRVVAPPASKDALSRWAEDFRLSRIQFDEADVSVFELDIAPCLTCGEPQTDPSEHITCRGSA